MVPQNYEILVKPKTDREFLKETRPPYIILKSIGSEVDIPDMKFENVDKVLKFHMESSSLSSIKLKPGDILREISQIDEDSLELRNSNVRFRKQIFVLRN